MMPQWLSLNPRKRKDSCGSRVFPTKRLSDLKELTWLSLLNYSNLNEFIIIYADRLNIKINITTKYRFVLSMFLCLMWYIY